MLMENLKLKTQQKNYLKLNRIILTVVFVLITIGVLIPVLVAHVPMWIYALIVVGIWIVFTLIFWHQGAAFRHFSYAMSDYGLYINQGVFWRRKIIVPRNRVQHTDVIQGPLERKFDLAELVVHTAGTRNASVKLPGITHETAEKLRDSLSFEESNDAV